MILESELEAVIAKQREIELKKSGGGPSAIAFKRSDADFDFPQRKVHDLELQVLEVA